MIPHNVAEIIRQHITLEVEGIDRMYLNAYVPGLQTEGGFVHFVRKHLGFPIASTAEAADKPEAICPPGLDGDLPKSLNFLHGKLPSTLR